MFTPPLVPPIDRHALVSRHDVVLTAYDGNRPLQVGNGQFAFGIDVTGLQTFAPFNTMSHWGWHSSPPPAGQKPEDFQGQTWDTHGRPVRYPMSDPQRPALSNWLRASPHRINLGRVGLVLTKADGSDAQATDLRNVRQSLDLWHGLVTSRFEVEGQPVTVTTACHPSVDSIGARVESPLIKAGRLAVFVEAPGDDEQMFANFVGRLKPGRFELRSSSKQRADLVRKLDGDPTHVALSWSGSATLRSPESTLPLEVKRAEYGREGHWLDVTKRVKEKETDGFIALHVDNDLGPDPAPGFGKSLRVTYSADGKTQTVEAPGDGDLLIDPSASRRRFVLRPASATPVFSFTCAFGPKPCAKRLPSAEATFAASRKQWPAYWQSGGAIDLSGSKDPRWRELERRIVLSQYLMAVNEAGAWPPQESGLVNNGWNGRFHLEMTWWHAAHWALWNRWPILKRSLGFYDRFLASSKARAKEQGFAGARWPKCVGPDGREAPGDIHALLIWQQPHPIFFAELDYRAHPTKATLEKWRPVVEATADFLASYAFLEKGRYVLGPPMYVVSENTDPKTTQNPAFELGYWRFGLRMAQTWRSRLGLPARADWQRVLDGLSPLPKQDGLYVLHEGVQDMWTRWNFEHPALIGTYGMLPGDGVDVPTMRRTLDKVASVWDFDRTWGWDFPMLAMCAARLSEPGRAVDFLLHPSGGFQFDDRGLATGGPYPYFPSNGGLLYAVAMMAAGWDGSKGSAPGFPKDGSWTVRWEGLSPAP